MKRAKSNNAYILVYERPYFEINQEKLPDKSAPVSAAPSTDEISLKTSPSLDNFIQKLTSVVSVTLL